MRRIAARLSTRAFQAPTAFLLACAAGTAVIVLLPLTGCEPAVFPNQAPASLSDVNAVRDDENLSAQEKRTELGRLGLDELTINAVLIDERTANQFGGDLRTAWQKVDGDRLDELTPDEIQIYTDAAEQEDSNLSFNLTDEQAAATTRLFADSGIRTDSDLSDLLNNPSGEIPSDIPENFLQNVLLDFDSDLLIPKLP